MVNPDNPKRTDDLSAYAVWCIALLVAAITAFVYLPSISNGWVNWDDPVDILENRRIHSFNASSIEWAFTNAHNGNWIPFNWLSHALVCHFYDLDPKIHHSVNLIFHALNALLAFFLFLSILNLAADLNRSQKPGSSQSIRTIIVAAMGALLWSLHPLHVESVAWITERKDTCSQFFILLSLLSYLLFASRDSKRGRWFILCLISFVISLLFKPMAVTLPVVLLILDWYPLNRIRFSGPHFFSAHSRLFLEKLPFFALSLLFGVIAIIAQGGAIMPIDRVPFDFRIMNAFHSIAFYLQKMFLPAGLVPLYPISTPSELTFSAQYIFSALIVIVITVSVFIAGLRRYPHALSAWLFYLVTLAPVLGILQVGRQAAADRYTYLPCLGLSLLLVAGAFSLQQALARSVVIIKKFKPVFLLTAACIAYLGALCAEQIGVWKDSVTLWEHQIENYPGASHIAHSNLARAYRTAGRLDDSIAAYRTANSIQPVHAYSIDGLGCAFLEKDLVDEAILEFKKSIAKDPEYALAHRNLWFAYRKKGMQKEALISIRKAIDLQPDYADAHSNLGLSLMGFGRLDGAVDAFQKALSLDPGNPDMIGNLATAYMNQNRLDKAAALYLKAMNDDDDNINNYMNLALIYLKQRKPDEAAAVIMKALAIDPMRAEIHQLLGEAHELSGRIAQAASSYENALQLDRNFMPALKGLSRCRKKKGKQ